MHPDRLTRSPRGLVELGDFEEVLAVPGHYLNDHCFIHHQGQWHFFGIIGPVGKSCFDEGSEVSFAHATSRDLHRWERRADVLHASAIWPATRHVWAPNVIEADGRFYMLYTALDDALNQRLCLATSSDLFEWEGYAGNPVIVPSLHWARWPNAGDSHWGACRDPHILRLDDGRFVAYWVSELRGPLPTEVTCVAASISDDLAHWQEVGPIFTLRAWDEPPTRAVESPCVVHKDGRYWLFFKHGWWTHVAASDNPLDFRDAAPARLGYCHASEVFEWDGGWWISHCSGDPTDYMYRQTNRTRGLFLGRLHWPAGEYPRLA
jgi:beta-xylosidase